MGGACDVKGCGTATDDVWGRYPEVTAHLGGHPGHVHLRLPLRRCRIGHLSGWRDGADFLVDLVQELREVDDVALGPDGPAPARRLFSKPRCGRCADRLVLEPTGRRLQGRVHLFLDTVADPLVADVDLPEVACAACGTPPTRHGGTVADTPADLLGWVLAWLAVAMPPDSATEVTPR